MDRCPNCGSSVRTGAKFCTTCGFRLPIQPPAPVSPGSTRSPFDLTSSVSAASGHWPEPAETPEPESAPLETPDELASGQEAAPDEPEVASGESPEPPAPAGAESAPFTGWPAYGTGFGPRTTWTGARQEESSAVTDGSLETVEEAISNWASGSEPPAASADLYQVSETADLQLAVESPHVPELEPAVDNGDSPVESEETAVDSVQIDAGTPSEPEFDLIERHLMAEAIAAAPGECEPEQIGSAQPDSLADAEAESVTGPIETPDSVEPPAELPPPATGDSRPAGDPIERAARLLDELNDLLPLIRAGAGQPDVDAAAIADALASSRTASEPEAAAFQSLRAAIAIAQARPRDIDVMLDLVSRADAIAGIIAAHDRYASAIDDAIAALRREDSDGTDSRG